MVGGMRGIVSLTYFSDSMISLILLILPSVAARSISCRLPGLRTDLSKFSRRDLISSMFFFLISLRMTLPILNDPIFSLAGTFTIS